MKPVDLLIFAGIGSKNEEFYQTPNKPWRSLGPSKIARQLRKHGYSVQVINFASMLSYDDLKLVSEQFVDQHTVIGISTTFLFGEYTSFSAFNDLKELLTEYKSKFGCKILLGGPTPVPFKEFFLADWTITGYAENQIVDFFNKTFRHGIKKHKDLWDIKTCDHKWHYSDKIQTGEVLPLEIGRGCIYSCKYCKFDMLGKKRGEYVRSMSMIKDEIVENYELYNVTSYMLMDDTFNDDPYKLNEWCDMLESLPFKIQYTGYCRADLLDRYQDISRRLYKTGMVGSTLGIESMNLVASKAIAKPWSGKRAKDFVPYYIHDICEGKTLTQINFIIGLPGDTVDDVWSWIEWAKENKIPTVHAQTLTIRTPKLFPNDSVYSEFDKNAEEHGYKFPNKNRPQVWHNNVMTWFDARKAYKKIIPYIRENFCDLSWHGFANQSLCYSIEDILNTKASSFYNDEYIKRSNEWFKNYVRSFNE